MTSRPAETAAAVADLEQLAGAARSCVACPELAATRERVVVGTVPSRGQEGVLLVGEAPGRHEDAAGRPFVGAAGRLLDELLAEAGLSRAEVAVTNVVKCRPPGNRKPGRAEVANCRHWLERQLALIGPAVVCALGGSAGEWALDRRAVRIGEVRGQVWQRQGRSLVVTYHPSAAIRFGPGGRPRADLREDLALVARLARQARGE